MEKQMNFVIQPSLKEIALRKVVMLWIQFDILNQIECFNPLSSIGLKTILKNEVLLVKNRISELTLPKSLLEDMMPLIKPIGCELIMWLDSILQIFWDMDDFVLSYVKNPRSASIFIQKALEKLSWTSMGTINYQKTAENFIRAEILDVYHLYLLACTYCLEDYVPILWEKLSEESKTSLCFKYENFLPISRPFLITHPHLAAFWILQVKLDDTEERFDNQIDFHHKVFLNAVQEVNFAATKYFYSKWPCEEKGVVLFKAAKDLASNYTRIWGFLPNQIKARNFSNVLCYLISQMSSKQQMEFLKHYSYCVLNSLLQWPWQDLFLDIADRTWDFLSKDEYVSILQYIGLSKTTLGLHVDLFRKFFRRSPASFKNYFIDQLNLPNVRVGAGNLSTYSEKFLYKMFKGEETEIIKCIFKHADALNKTRLIFSHQGLETCCCLIRSDKGHMLKLFIELSILSKEERKKLKEHLNSYISANYVDTELLRKMQQCEQFFHLPGASASSKRGLEDEIVTEGTHKILCTKEARFHKNTVKT